MGYPTAESQESELIGRDSELASIQEVFQAVKNGASHFVVIEGEPGVGKTSLAVRLTGEFVADGATFISGKFDVNHRNVPFSALVHGLMKFFNDEILNDEAKTDEMRARLNLFLSNNAGLVARVLPIIGKIMNIESAADIVSVSERKDRLNLALANLFLALAKPGCPLVIFLDDIQWADSASRHLIETLMLQDGAEGIMILATVRLNELNDIHPVKRLFNAFEDSSTPYTRLNIKNLTQLEVETFLEKRLKGRPEFFADLAKLVLDKTQGNPFYMEQFFSILCTQNVLQLSGNAVSFDATLARELEATENVLDLVASNVASLEPFTREVLFLGSCFGKRLAIGDLSTVGRWRTSDVEKALKNAAFHGLVLSVDGDHWAFAHDRIFETVYGMMDNEKKSEGHYRIASAIFKKSSEFERERMAFFLAHQFRLGANFIQSREQRLEVARLNLLAARKARESLNFESASLHVECALEIMPEMDWQSQGDLLYALYMIKAETTAFNGDSDTAGELFELILRNVSDDKKKSEVIRLQMSIKFFFGEYQDGVNLGIEGLKRMGGSGFT